MLVENLKFTIVFTGHLSGDFPSFSDLTSAWPALSKTPEVILKQSTDPVNSLCFYQMSIHSML